MEKDFTQMHLPLSARIASRGPVKKPPPLWFTDLSADLNRFEGEGGRIVSFVKSALQKWNPIIPCNH